MCIFVATSHSPRQHLGKLEKLGRDSPGARRISRGLIFPRSGYEIQRIAESFPEMRVRHFLEFEMHFNEVCRCIYSRSVNISRGPEGVSRGQIRHAIRLIVVKESRCSIPEEDEASTKTFSRLSRCSVSVPDSSVS